MNLDEFMLRNVLAVEEAQFVHKPSTSPPAATGTASLFIGKINGDVEPRHDPMAVVSVSTVEMDWVQYQREMLVDSKLPDSETVYNHENLPDFRVGQFENSLQTVSFPTAAMSATSSNSNSADSGRKRRNLDDMKEKTIERRQSRMIKNRESAARSRARKQAYTNQLEHEVCCLRKTNGWLKKQEEIEMLLSNPLLMPKYQLRRTSSALF